jgi:hypothetical protein
MSLLSDSELSAIARNHARVAAIPTQAQTLDMFAQGEQTEELTLCGEILTERPARARSNDRQTQIFLT